MTTGRVRCPENSEDQGMFKASHHPHVLIATITALCTMAWMTAGVQPSSMPPGLRVAAVDRVQELRLEPKWLRVQIDRGTDEPNVAAFEEDDLREEVRESIRSSSIVHFDRPESNRQLDPLLVPDCESRGDSHGGRRGPPPRMPPA
ncbi:hypothetical protein SAMN05444166_1925 [Singulisphaera sp. GP187]|nr:hypothetical protein SAMN05444166_1925 [Singulisphaera sp. GP187]